MGEKKEKNQGPDRVVIPYGVDFSSDGDSRKDAEDHCEPRANAVLEWGRMARRPEDDGNKEKRSWVSRELRVWEVGEPEIRNKFEILKEK